MRKINAFMKGRIASNDLKTYSLLDLELSSQTFYFADQTNDIQLDGETTVYQGDPGVLQFDPPRQSSSVDREAFAIVLADTLGAFKSEISQNLAGKSVRVRTGFFNADGTINTDPANVLLTYSGYIDSSSYNNDFGAASMSIECSSPMQDLGLVKTMITSPDGMDQFNVTDTSFDRVIEDNQLSALWGKT